MYFLKGSLPWQGIQARTKKEKYDKIKQKKLSISCESLCRGYPEEFQKYFQYVRELKFEAKPDISLLRKLFKDLFQKCNYEYDYMFDWVIRKQQKKAAALIA